MVAFVCVRVFVVVVVKNGGLTEQNDYAAGHEDLMYQAPELELGQMQAADPDAGLEEGTWETFPDKDFRGLQVVLRVNANLSLFFWDLILLF